MLIVLVFVELSPSPPLLRMRPLAISPGVYSVNLLALTDTYRIHIRFR